MSNTIVPKKLKPDWHPAVIDGEPVELLNIDAVTLMVFDSALGVDGALAKLKAALPGHYYDQIEERVEAAR